MDRVLQWPIQLRTPFRHNIIVYSTVIKPVLREEVEEAVHSLKAGQSPRVDIIPSELLKNGGEATTTALTAMCQKVLETKEWPKDKTQLLVIPLPRKKKRQPQAMSALSHSQLSQPSQQDHALSYPQLTQGQG